MYEYERAAFYEDLDTPAYENTAAPERYSDGCACAGCASEGWASPTPNNPYTATRHSDSWA